MASPVINSLRELAPKLGISHEALRKRIKHPAWGFGSGPWKATDVPRMIEWAKKTLTKGAEADGESSVSLTKARTYAAIAQAKRTNIQTSILEGKYHDSETCKIRRVRALHELKTELLAVPDSLPFELPQKDIVRAAIESVLERKSKAYVKLDPAN